MTMGETAIDGAASPPMAPGAPVAPQTGDPGAVAPGAAVPGVEAPGAVPQGMPGAAVPGVAGPAVAGVPGNRFGDSGMAGGSESGSGRDPGDGSGAGAAIRPLELLHGVEMAVTVELGRTRVAMRELLGLRAGSIVELDRPAGGPVDVVVNGTLLARGEVVVVDDELGVRITEVVGTAEDR